ncbi:regulator of G-protein signaling 14 [Discoglossus pictus]
MLGKMKYLEVPNGRLVLAVSDGELNHADHNGRGSDHSLNSLPSVQSAGLASDRSVASWAVSFERLLQDPLGIEYFTEFLKKEYSAENIGFWQACEKFHSIPAGDTEQLLQESRRIYNEFLSSSSLCPVNVDHQALITEDMLEKPTPDMFKAQQLQIFNLMKFDSYARFVKSPLYQECMVAEVEGRPLPHHSQSHTSHEEHHCSHTTGAVKKKSLRSGKSLPIGVEATGADSDTSSKYSRRSFKKKDRKGHGKDSDSEFSSRRESQTSLNSASSLDPSSISSFSTKSENDNVSHSSMGPEADHKPLKYCCVYFPDGTASLTAVRPGLSIRDMLNGVCEKRGYCPTDVKVYLTGKEQKALALDQECTVLTDQEIRLENRIGFDLQIEPLHKSVHLVAKSTKTLGEALEIVLKKYGLDIDHVLLTKFGETQAVDQGISVNEVAGQKLVLEKVDETGDVKHTGEHAAAHHTMSDSEQRISGMLHKPGHHHRAQRDGEDMNHLMSLNSHRETPHMNNKKYGIEELVELLNRVQHSRAEDQRGLLTKEDLVLPDFLRLPIDTECGNCHGCSLNLPTQLPKTTPPHLDVSQTTTNYSEHNNSSNTRSSTSQTKYNPDSQATNVLAPCSGGTHANIDSANEGSEVILHHQ